MVHTGRTHHSPNPPPASQSTHAPSVAIFAEAGVLHLNRSGRAEGRLSKCRCRHNGGLVHRTVARRRLRKGRNCSGDFAVSVGSASISTRSIHDILSVHREARIFFKW